MRHYIISWCHEGLETVQEIHDPEAEQVWAVLNNTTPDNRETKMIYMMMMRARANTHRHYEIYAVNTDDSISAEDLTSMFKDDPQYAADLLRNRGVKVYSDRVNPDHYKIV